jgi:hypothetical protein
MEHTTFRFFRTTIVYTTKAKKNITTIVTIVHNRKHNKAQNALP